MPDDQRQDARAWARENLVGCSAVTLPSYSADLKSLNERGIRHDIERVVKLGFSYTLLCSEVAITAQENARFTAWARETAGGKLGLFFHAAFGTLADNIEAVKLAEKRARHLRLHQGLLRRHRTRGHAVSHPHLGLRARAPCGHVAGIGEPAAARLPQHRRHQVGAGFPAAGRHLRDVPPLS